MSASLIRSSLASPEQADQRQLEKCLSGQITVTEWTHRAYPRAEAYWRSDVADVGDVMNDPHPDARSIQYILTTDSVFRVAWACL